MSRRPDRNEMLLEAGLALSSELSLDAVLQRIVELAVAVTGASLAPSRPRHLLTEPGMGYRFEP